MLILIFRGRGWAIFGCWLVINALIALAVEATTGTAEYYVHHPGWIGLSQLLTAGALYVLAGTWLQAGPDRVLEDIKTHETITIRGRHTFFWLEASQWGWLLAAVGIACELVQLWLVLRG